MDSRITWALSACVALGVAGCASASKDITPTYVSPYMYDNLSCQQIAMEAQNVSARAAEAAGSQDSQRTKDAVVTGVAIVVFWPAAFFVGGDKQTAAELARLRGELEALEQVSVRKNCGIEFRHEAAPPAAAPPQGGREDRTP